MEFNWSILTFLLTCFMASQAFTPTTKYLSARGVLIEDWCSDLYVFRIFTNVIIYECADECMRRTRCLSFLYHGGMKLCMLRREATVTPPSIAGLYRLCWSSDILTWDLAVIGPCAIRSCDRKSRCRGTFSVICDISECLHAPEMPDSKVISQVTNIGSQTLYVCLRKYSMTGDPSITCTENGSWSSSSFECKRRCEFNAEFDEGVILTESPKIYVENDSVDYACAEGYMRDPDYENETLICSSNGTWSQPHCI